MEEEELSESEVASMVEKLVALKQDLTTSLEALSTASEPVDLDTPIGRLSRMDAIQQQKMAEANVAKVEVRLKQIDQALAAAAEGRYGECRKCGDTIARKRLSARPESPFCLDCQGAREDR